MINNKIFWVLLLFVFYSNAQNIGLTEKFNLPATIEETSGLIYYNGRLITHNDSGNTAQLFELDTISGTISRTVTIANATNVDWEDIAQDDTYIYVGDIGNNSGDRNNLKIYRVSKSDYENSTNINADIINYSYADQVDFTPNSNNTDWDAEGLIVWGDYLFIFSKNWVNNEVDVYSIPKTIGTHSATKVSTFNASGLITGAVVSGGNEKIYLTGYSESTVTPFIIMLYNISINPPSSSDLFANSENYRFNSITGFGNQVEGISFIEKNGTVDHLLITNEYLFVNPLTFDAKLRSVDIDSETLSVSNATPQELRVYPNPFKDRIHFNSVVEQISLFDNLGRLVLQKTNVQSVDTSGLSQGVYYLKLYDKHAVITMKLIK